MAVGDPSGICLHHTGSKNEAGDIYWLSHYHTNPVSVNQLVKRDGTIVQIVPNDVVAWHAGYSELNGREACNEWCIGVEICNAGDGKEAYTDAQYESVGETVAYNAARYHINDRNISSHARVATNPPGRKTDPLGWDWLRMWAVVDRLLANWPASWGIPKWNGVGYRITSTK
jgi:N-acetyl-anhydromuramyl-L-alanine amidase AmpD